MLRGGTYLVALGAAALLAGGCGGGEDDGSAPRASTAVGTGTITKEAFLARTNRICGEAWKVTGRNFAEYSRGQSQLSGRRLYADSVRFSYLGSVDLRVFEEIFSSRAPEGEAEEVEAIVGALKAAIERGQRVVRVTTPAQLEALFAEYNRLARAYGLSECLAEGDHLPRLSR